MPHCSLEIRDIAVGLPERVVTNTELGQENADWKMDVIGPRTGVFARHIADERETALDLGERACRQLLARHPGLVTSVDALIFCTQTPDHPMPPNACILHDRLGLEEACLAFDITLACSGYVYGLAMASSLLLSELVSTVLLVTGDTYSRLIHPRDRSARVLFGDGAAATLLTRPAGEGSGLLDIRCRTSGKGHDAFIVPAGGSRMPRSAETSVLHRDRSGGERTLEHIHMNGMRIVSFVSSKIPSDVRALLAENQLTVDDIDLFVFHQASAIALDSLSRLLGLPAGKVYRNLDRVGNTVSASIPIALREAIDEGVVQKGDRVVLVGFGVGLSWGSALLRL